MTPIGSKELGIEELLSRHPAGAGQSILSKFLSHREHRNTPISLLLYAASCFTWLFSFLISYFLFLSHRWHPNPAWAGSA
jgi:uncharacterized membrane protein YbhN (UPF0104 family)